MRAMKVSLTPASLLSVGQLPRQRGEAETPTSNQPPRVAQGHRLMGPTALRTCPFASLLSQVRARLGPGGYCWCSRNGGPQTCLPAACGVAQAVAQYGSSSSTQAQDPHEGPCLAGRTTQGFLIDDNARLAREEAERSRQGTSRGARDASHDDRDQAGAGLRNVLVSSLVQRGQAQAWSTEASGKGCHFSATRPRQAEQQDGGHRGAQYGVSPVPLAAEDQL